MSTWPLLSKLRRRSAKRKAGMRRSSRETITGSLLPSRTSAARRATNQNSSMVSISDRSLSNSKEPGIAFRRIHLWATLSMTLSAIHYRKAEATISPILSAIFRKESMRHLLMPVPVKPECSNTILQSSRSDGTFGVTDVL